MSIHARLGLLIGLLFVAGCTANQAGIYRTVALDGGDSRSIVVDAKQRSILAVDDIDSDGNVVTRFCAEPSPDALSAIATSFALSSNVGIVGQGSGAASIGQALRETAQQLGTRTATIQLLRDSYYRLCEASVNGKLNRSNYLLLANKLKTSMMMLLAIEQITGGAAGSLEVTNADGGTVNVNATRAPGLPDATPRDGDQDESEQTTSNAGSSANVEGGGASVGTVVLGGAAQPVPENVTDTIESLSERFVRLSLAQDCLILMDKAAIDLFNLMKDGRDAEAFRNRHPVIAFCDGVMPYIVSGEQGRPTVGSEAITQSELPAPTGAQ